MVGVEDDETFLMKKLEGRVGELWEKVMWMYLVERFSE